MARMPAADWLGEHSPRTPMSRHDIVCVHTIVGYAPAHAAHFSVRASGQILQSRDTAYRSAANLDGNYRIIAIENEDHGPAFPRWGGSDVPPLTDAQVDANARILAWAHQEHGIPLQMCPDARPGSRGLAYHRQGVDGNFGGHRFAGRVADGERWSSAFGKVCPGDNRIAQLPRILELARAAVEGKDWFDMATEADLTRIVVQAINAAVPAAVEKALDDYRVPVTSGSDELREVSLRRALRVMGNRIDATRDAVREIRGLLTTPTEET